MIFFLMRQKILISKKIPYGHNVNTGLTYILNLKCYCGKNLNFTFKIIDYYIYQYIPEQPNQKLNHLHYIVLDMFFSADLTGDTNLDRKINVSDAVFLGSYLINKRESITLNADINGDGEVNVFDMIAIRRNIINFSD